MWKRPPLRATGLLARPSGNSGSPSPGVTPHPSPFCSPGILPSLQIPQHFSLGGQERLPLELLHLPTLLPFAEQPTHRTPHTPPRPRPHAWHRPRPPTPPRPLRPTWLRPPLALSHLSAAGGRPGCLQSPLTFHPCTHPAFPRPHHALRGFRREMSTGRLEPKTEN